MNLHLAIDNFVGSFLTINLSSVSESGEHSRNKHWRGKIKRTNKETIFRIYHQKGMEWKQRAANKAEKVEKSDETVQIIREFEQIIRSKNKNIIWLAYQQGKVFEKFKENAKVIEMVRQLGYSKSTITFKINIVKLINQYPKVKNSSLSLIFFLKIF